MPRAPIRLAKVPVQWWIRLLDGERLWGSSDYGPGQDAAVWRRLFVFPPGATGTERRLLRLSRAWPVWGAALWLTSEVSLSSTLPPWAAFVISTMAYIGLEAALLGRVGALRRQVLELSVDPIAGHSDQRFAAIHIEINALAE